MIQIGLIYRDLGDGNQTIESLLGLFLPGHLIQVYRRVFTQRKDEDRLQDIQVFFPVAFQESDNSVRIIKDGTSIDDSWSKNSILMEWHPNASGSIDTSNYSDPKDITGLTLGDYTYNGTIGTIPGDWGAGMLMAEHSGGYFLANMYLRVGSLEISLDDADVQAILASVKVK